MKKKKKQIDYHKYEFGDQVENLNSCSTTDATGVMWRAAQDEEEMESYRDIYDFEPPRTLLGEGRKRRRK